MAHMLREWHEVVGEDFPPVGAVTKYTKEQIATNPQRFRGSIRVSMGLIWEDREFEDRRARVEHTPLP